MPYRPAKLIQINMTNLVEYGWYSYDYGTGDLSCLDELDKIFINNLGHSSWGNIDTFYIYKLQNSCYVKVEGSDLDDETDSDDEINNDHDENDKHPNFIFEYDSEDDDDDDSEDETVSDVEMSYNQILVQGSATDSDSDSDTDSDIE